MRVKEKVKKMKPNPPSNILKNERGVALLMVLSTVVILTALMTDFSFETAINKIKGYNVEDRGQAKLNAEAGLRFAMTRLKLYKEGYNMVSKNADASKVVSQEKLNIIWNFPFVYPIPVNSEMNQVQKDAIEDFSESAILNGQMSVTISNISNKISLNLLRANILNQQVDDDGNPILIESANEEEDNYDIHKTLYDAINVQISEKSESDDAFYNRYSSLDPDQLVGMFKYFVSDPSRYEGMFKNEAQNAYDLAEITPKGAPYSSFSELYMAPIWSDELIDLIKNEFSVHGGIFIDLNKITKNMLRILVPNINADEIKEFFDYRDDPDNPKYFNKLDDFKRYIVNTAALMSSDGFDEKFAEYEKEGIKFGTAPSLFLVIATGIVGRATFTLNAYVIMPPKVEPPKDPNAEDENATVNPNTNPNDNPSENPNENEGEGENGAEEPPIELLDPRIIEIMIN
jgi:hypothetical protein